MTEEMKSVGMGPSWEYEEFRRRYMEMTGEVNADMESI